MSVLRIVSAALLAVPLLVFGGNYFVGLFELPAAGDSDGEQLLLALRDGGLMGAIAFSHVVAGVLLLVPRTRFLGALLQLPMSIGIVAFHVTMLPAGLPMALVMQLLNLGAMADPPKLRGLVAKNPV